MRRAGPIEGLGARSRVALFHNTTVTASEALEMDDESIGYETMLQSGVKTTNLQVAGVGPMSLHKRGFDDPNKLRSFGFDAGHLCDPSWCNEACMAYGRAALMQSFVVTAGDAVAIAGSEAVLLLNITTNELLERCAGFPGEALAVLQQLPQGISLKGVLPRVLLDAGLRITALKTCGYGLRAVVDQTGADARELVKLGFSM